jgi:hypothetical protein
LLAQIKLDNPSATLDECAKQLGVNPATIRLWLKQPLYQSYENWFLQREFERQPLSLKMSRAEVQDNLDEFAQEMLLRLKDIAETSHDSKLIAQIGFDALDRAGYAAARKDSARPINLIFTPELISVLRRRAEEVQALDAVVVGQ